MMRNFLCAITNPLPLAASCGNNFEGAEVDQGRKSSTTRVPTSAVVSLSETDNPYQLLFGVSVFESSPTSDLSDKRTGGSPEEAGLEYQNIPLSGKNVCLMRAPPCRNTHPATGLLTHLDK